MAKNSKKIDEDKEIISKTTRRFSDSFNYAEQGWHTRWDRDWKLYNNMRVNRSYEGITDSFTPMVFSTIETMTAALGNGRPTFDYVSDNPLDETDTKTLNALVDSYWQKDNWDVKMVDALRQMLMVGTAPLMLHWDIDHPVMTHFGIRDAIIDPTLVSPFQLLNGEGYAGRRYLTTVKELETYRVVDVDQESKTYGELVDRFKNLDQVHAGKESPDDMDKAEKEMFMDSTIPEAAKRQIEVIEIWDTDYVCTIANRTTVIEYTPNPYKDRHRQILQEKYMQEAMESEDIQLQLAEGTFDMEAAEKEARTQAEAEAKGIIPFVFLRNYTDVSLFYGKSEVEPIAPTQELLNDLTDQYVDAITAGLKREAELDPAYEEYQDKIGLPGSVYPFKPGSLNYLDPPAIPANAFNERLNLKNEIRETTAVDQVAKGVSNAQEKTAYEVRAQLNQAGQRIDIKARMLEKDGFSQLGSILFRMIKLYVTRPIPVRVKNNHGTDVQIFDPAKFHGDWKPHVSLDITAQQRRQEERAAALETYQILMQDPTNNLSVLKELLFPKMFDFDPEDIQRLLTPEQGAGGLPGEAMPGEGMAPGMSPGGAPPAAAGAPVQALPAEVA